MLLLYLIIGAILSIIFCTWGYVETESTKEGLLFWFIIWVLLAIFYLPIIVYSIEESKKEV